MRFINTVLVLLMFQCASAQNISYSIAVPNSGRAGVTELPTTIDTSHFYSYREINHLAKPTLGWNSYYQLMGELEYPEHAKNRKIQSSIIVGFKVDKNGEIIRVFIESFRESSKWKKCEACETLIIDFFMGIEWLPGQINNENVKTINYEEVSFTIYDPKSNRNNSPFH